MEDIDKKLISLKLNKAPDLDGIPNWVFRDFAGFLAKRVAVIFNSFFREGFILQVWKSANVVPLSKATAPERLEKDLHVSPIVSPRYGKMLFLCPKSPHLKDLIKIYDPSIASPYSPKAIL